MTTPYDQYAADRAYEGKRRRRKRALRWIILIACAFAFLMGLLAGRAEAGYTPSYSAPPVRSYSPPASSYSRPTYTPSSPSSIVKSYSPPSRSIAGSGSGSSYKPPTTPPARPTTVPSSVPRTAFDTNSAHYWANPASPYYWFFLATYGEGDDGSNDDAWAIWFLVAVIVLTVGACGWMFWDMSRY